MNAISKAIFETLSPKAQGFWWELQRSWNEELPSDCPYPKGSTERHEWVHGQFQAIREFEGTMEAMG
jgi:hypothetical protein